MGGKFKFSIDRGGTFTDIYAKCPNGKVHVMKLLSVDPINYSDAPREGIRRILETVKIFYRIKKQIILKKYFHFSRKLEKVCHKVSQLIVVT